jgi:hypothetical protein
MLCVNDIQFRILCHCSCHWQGATQSQGKKNEHSDENSGHGMNPEKSTTHCGTDARS